MMLTITGNHTDDRNSNCDHSAGLDSNNAASSIIQFLIYGNGFRVLQLDTGAPQGVSFTRGMRLRTGF